MAQLKQAQHHITVRNLAGAKPKALFLQGQGWGEHLVYHVHRLYKDSGAEKS